MVQGKGHLRLDHEVFPLQPGQLFVLRPSMDIEAMLESGCAECYILVLRSAAITKRKGSWSCDSAETSSALPQGSLRVKLHRPILEQVHRLHRDRLRRQNAADVFEWQLHFQSLLQFLLSALKDPGNRDEADQGIDRSIGYMYKHFQEKIKLDTLADIAGLTQTSYSRSFKKAKGVSPVEFLNKIRIGHSKAYLQQSGSIKEVSGLVGFGNEFYFSRMFKRETGMTPALYLRRKELKVAVATCFRYGDNLRSLGVPVLAEWNGYFHTEQSGPEQERHLQIKLHEIGEAKPDIVLADYRHLPFYEQLKRIAPTVVLDFTMDWRKNHRRIAELVGREKEAEHHFVQIEQKIKQARDLLAHTIGSHSVSVMRLYDRKLRLQGAGDHPVNDLLYAELGLKPGSGTPLSERVKDYQLDHVPFFETDYLFIYKYLSAADEDQVLSKLQTGSWSSTGAFRNSRVRFVSNWIGLSWSPIGQHRIIDELLQSVSER
ncbi:AraC family transcriptional regulator [Paenibacillus hamazuiensis]|uniref:AraC family transcriptional regulator n=1 Tax=Paenibacillus hamazuiensis TaxID=2936508 RepID=UPI00200C1C07